MVLLCMWNGVCANILCSDFGFTSALAMTMRWSFDWEICEANEYQLESLPRGEYCYIYIRYIQCFHTSWNVITLVCFEHLPSINALACHIGNCWYKLIQMLWNASLAGQQIHHTGLSCSYTPVVRQYALWTHAACVSVCLYMLDSSIFSYLPFGKMESIFMPFS